MKRTSTTRLERGFSLVTAIFILVVLALLGTAIVTVSTGQHVAVTADVQGARAYWAARSAADAALMQLLQPEDTSGAAVFAGCMAVPQTVTLAGITGFTVQVTNCIADGPYTDSGLNLTVYTVTARATSGTVGSATYVEREVTVQAAKCKDPNAVLPGGAADPRNRCS
jgi:MSHA biogenesis protein MshP